MKRMVEYQILKPEIKIDVKLELKELECRLWYLNLNSATFTCFYLNLTQKKNTFDSLQRNVFMNIVPIYLYIKRFIYKWGVGYKFIQKWKKTDKHWTSIKT